MSSWSFSTLIPGWPEDAPQTPIELHLADESEFADYDEETRSKITWMQAEILSAIRARSSSAPLSNPIQVHQALTVPVKGANGRPDVTLFEKSWNTFVLDKSRRRVFKHTDASSSRVVRKRTPKVPGADDLVKHPLPDGGRYLLCWGGDPGILNIPDVRDRLVELINDSPVCDVIFHMKVPGSLPTTWSLRDGNGFTDDTKVPFPNPEHVQDVISKVTFPNPNQ